MPYAIYHLKVPKKILTNIGIVSGNPDKDGLVVDTRFTSRSKCAAKVVDDVQRFVHDRLFIHTAHAKDEDINSVEELNFEIQMSSHLFFGLLKDIRLEAVSIINPKHNETIDRVMNIIENKGTVLAAVRNKSTDNAMCAKEVIGGLEKMLVLLFDESMSHRQDITVAQMDIGLIDLYKWL